MVEPSGSLHREVDRLGSRLEGALMSEARLLPGAPVAAAVLADVTERVARLRERGVTPSLATILVGDDDASAGYIRVKQRQAGELGFISPHRHLPADSKQDDLLAVIA